MTIADQIVELLDGPGRAAYLGEPVSQAEHALQAAWLAEQSGAPDDLIVAALLHDVGHLVLATVEDPSDLTLDWHHEDAGAAWLESHFGPRVSGPAQLHVAAKRYLCAVEPSYRAALSQASIQSLELQGGPMSPGEVAQFEQHPDYLEAVRLRRWDDEAKVAGMAVPGADHYRTRIEALALRKGV